VQFEPGFGESGLGFTVNYHVAEFAAQSGVRNELRKRILRRFLEEGIEIPLTSRTVYLRGGKSRRAESETSGQSRASIDLQGQ
jgi:small-conductance mechanosensitive channel